MKSASKLYIKKTLILSFSILFFSACTSSKKTEPDFKTADNFYDSDSSILLSFAGDIMAHKPNWNIKNFDEVYEDVKELLYKSDAAFVNIETPVSSQLPYSSYPEFNVKDEYADAAIKAGFNVFSLSNNHTNDQGLEGMKATKKYFDKKRSVTLQTSRPVYSSGIKDLPSDPLSYDLITIKNWKILYLAVTELLNRPTYSSYINYIKTDKKSRENFITQVKELRQENPCDLFVLSFHTAEEEYVLTTKDSQKKFYQNLLDAGVDVINANHPHVPKEWEVYKSKNDSNDKIIFYSQGNTISAQRTSPTYDNPDTIRDYTGEGFITQVRFLKTKTDEKEKINIIQVDPVLITTYITPQWKFVIKKLDEDFILSLISSKRKSWSSYLKKRMYLMENIKGKLIWQ